MPPHMMLMSAADTRCYALLRLIIRHRQNNTSLTGAGVTLRLMRLCLYADSALARQRRLIDALLPPALLPLSVCAKMLRHADV